MTGGAHAAAERPHAAGPEPGWSESWSFDFTEAGGLTGVVTLTSFPAQERSSYEASVEVPDVGLVIVRDQELPLPRARPPHRAR